MPSLLPQYGEEAVAGSQGLPVAFQGTQVVVPGLFELAERPVALRDECVQHRVAPVGAEESRCVEHRVAEASLLEELHREEALDLPRRPARTLARLEEVRAHLQGFGGLLLAPEGDQHHRPLQLERGVVGCEGAGRVQVEERHPVLPELPENARQVHMGEQERAAEVEDLAEETGRVDEPVAVEAPDGRHERRVQVAELEPPVVRGETAGLGEGGERFVEASGAQAGEAEQAVGGRQVRTGPDRRRELADGPLEIADREVGAAEEHPSRGRSGAAADERREGPDGHAVFAQGVAAAAEVQEGEREPIRRAGDPGEEVRGPAVLAASAGLDGLRVERRVIGPVGVGRRVPAFRPASYHARIALQTAPHRLQRFP